MYLCEEVYAGATSSCPYGLKGLCGIELTLTDLRLRIYQSIIEQKTTSAAPLRSATEVSKVD
jgi:hypothetical protein